MTKCIVKGCPNTTSKNSGVKLHGFPNSLLEIKVWLQQIGNDIRDIDAFAQRVLDSRKRWIFRICSAHFSPQSYIWDGKKFILRGDAIPTIFPGKKSRTASVTTDDGRAHLPTKKIKVESVSRPTLSGQSHGAANPGTRKCCHSGHVMKDVYTSMHKKMVDASTSTDAQCNRVDRGVQWPEFEFNFDGEPWKVQLDHFYPSCNATPEKTTKKCKTPAQSQDRPSVSGNNGSLDFLEAPNNTWQTSRTCVTIPSNKTTRFNCKSQPYGSMATCTSPAAENVVLEDDLARERKFMVFESCLDDLLYRVTCRYGQGCTARIRKLEKHVNGSLLSVTGHCLNGHRTHIWQSQPTAGDISAGDVLTAAALLFSGSDFQKLQEMSRLLGLQQISLSAYHNYQQRFLFPTVDLHWVQEQARLQEAFRNTQLTLAGDRQREIQGHSSKYCVYTFLDVATSRVVDFQMEQETKSASSAAMEKRAFRRCLDRLLEDFEIKTVSTDSHQGIGKVMSESYSQILHEYDVWQYARGVRKRLISASKKKSCSELGRWIPAVGSHLWWCACTSGGNEDMLRERWQSLLLHITDQHEWNGASVYHSCAHGPLTAEQRSVRPWLRKESPGLATLQEVVLDPRITQDLSQLSQYCHTAETEIYHRFVSKYRSRGKRFKKDAMEARTKLAALAHNANVHKRNGPLNYKWSRTALGTRKRKLVFHKPRNSQGSHHLCSGTLNEHVWPMMVDVLKRCSGQWSDNSRTRTRPETS
ncbi:uncharacterized protein RCH25_025912 [Pelodytes ibericus]